MFANWKTTLLGVLSLVLTGLALKYEIIKQIATPLLGVLAGLLGIVAKDASNNKTP